MDLILSLGSKVLGTRSRVYIEENTQDNSNQILDEDFDNVLWVPYNVP